MHEGGWWCYGISTTVEQLKLRVASVRSTAEKARFGLEAEKFAEKFVLRGRPWSGSDEIQVGTVPTRDARHSTADKVIIPRQSRSSRFTLQLQAADSSLCDAILTVFVIEKAERAKFRQSRMLHTGRSRDETGYCNLPVLSALIPRHGLESGHMPTIGWKSLATRHRCPTIPLEGGSRVSPRMQFRKQLYDRFDPCLEGYTAKSRPLKSAVIQ